MKMQKINERGLQETAKQLTSDSKGLLAMDESTSTCNKRFAQVGVPQTVEARRAYRELIVTTPGLGNYISGVILYDETIRQAKKDGTPFLKVLKDAGIVPELKSIQVPKTLPGILKKRSPKGWTAFVNDLPSTLKWARVLRNGAP